MNKQREHELRQNKVAFITATAAAYRKKAAEQGVKEVTQDQWIQIVRKRLKEKGTAW